MIKINENKIIYFTFILGFIFLIFSSVTLGYYGKNINVNAGNNSKNPNNDSGINNQQNNSNSNNMELQDKKYVTGLLIGYDKSNYLTDVLMVGYLDIEHSKFKLISIPRDLEIDFRDDLFKDIKQDNPKNKIKKCKLNEIYLSLGNDDRALNDLKLVISRIIGVDIEYIATIKIDVFKEVVDSVGGVWFDVPQNMNYEDKYQDLYIHLKKGHQLLDGNKAEQLVRFRQYEMGDLQRVEVQRNFLSALTNKVLSESTIDEVLNLVSTTYSNIYTNIGLMDVLKYSKVFYDLRNQDILNNENMITIPSYGEKVNGQWKQYWNKAEIDKAVIELLQK